MIKRYHQPATPYARALAHPAIDAATKAKLRAMHATLDPVVLLAAVRAAQQQLGDRVDGRGRGAALTSGVVDSQPSAVTGDGTASRSATPAAEDGATKGSPKAGSMAAFAKGSARRQPRARPAPSTGAPTYAANQCRHVPRWTTRT